MGGIKRFKISACNRFGKRLEYLFETKYFESDCNFWGELWDLRKISDSFDN